MLDARQEILANEKVSKVLWKMSYPAAIGAAVMALYGLAYGLIFPSISALVADHSYPDERGVATGTFHALLTAGVAIGAPVMGWVAEAVGVRTGLMLTAVVMALALGVIVVVLFPRKRA